MLFGTLADGTAVERYGIEDAIAVDVITYGAAITSIRVPDREGRLGEVALHHMTLEDYATLPGRYGAIIGRYANRISGGRFDLDGHTYELAKNDGKNTLHGGVLGFDKAVWQVEEVRPDLLRLSHTSPDGDQGFPGRLNIDLEYRVAGTQLSIRYRAVTGAPTVINLTNHTYFNLRGAGNADTREHVLQILASRYTVADAQNVPTGEFADVAGTAVDFREPRQVGTAAYDCNFVLDRKSAGLSLAAMAGDPVSGRIVHVLTTEPGLQLYTGDPHGIALETQHFPDSPNHPDFPSTVLRPSETFVSQTIYRFAV